MAQLLHLETSTKICSVALSENGNLIDVIEENSEEYIHAERLTVFIEKICKNNNVPLSNLDGIVVTSGPGSYTGLRIGVSTAKGLCYALNIPLLSVNSLETIAYLAQKEYPDTNICVAIDARRMEVFSTIYTPNLEILKPLSADIIDETTYADFEPFVLCGDATNKIKEIWENRKVQFDPTLLSSAAGQVEIAYQKFKKKEFENIAYFEPLYLKDFVVIKSKKGT